MVFRVRKAHVLIVYACVSWTATFLAIHQWAGSTTSPHDNVVTNNFYNNHNGDVVNARRALQPPFADGNGGGGGRQVESLYSKHTSGNSILQELETIDLTYFVYEDSDLLMKDAIHFVKHPKKRNNSSVRKRRVLVERYRQDALIEVDMMSRFLNYTGKLRVYDPFQASVVMVPIPIGVGLIRQGQRKLKIPNRKPSWFHPLQDAFDALMNKSTYQELQGNRHVMISLTQPAFDYSNEANTNHAGLTRDQYQLLANVTVAREVDPFACANLTVYDPTNAHDFADLFAEKLPVTQHAFSIGLGAGVGFPFVEASMEKFQAAFNFLFYQTRLDEPFAHNSTPYRHALMLDPMLNTTLPKPFRVGFGINNRTEWFEEFMNSKFCLVVRGDTPHSHALLRAIKVGCVPVVVSDYYSMYAPTFVSSLRLEDFVIFIREEDFLRAPAQELLRIVQGLSDSELRQKIASLKVAQRVLLYDHPQSLFIAAFLKEATIAMKASHPELVPTEYGLKEQHIGAKEIRERRRQQSMGIVER